ncbi:lipase [Thiomicrorhabdus indica]|uniref:lipase n=1 Tax=Thiomicrorhabdus indica TaxID=2267253 RepID=UPI00102DF171|nr:lipase [Thiomicrorhabdus indica]
MNATFKGTHRFALGGLLVAAVFGLTGCGSDSPDVSLETVGPPAENGWVVMDFENGDIPFPHDALFSGSADGTLNIPVVDPTDYSDPKVAMNAVDGFSTSAPISFSVTKQLDLTDLNANTIADTLERGISLYKVSVDPLTRAVTKIVSRLTLGVDFALAVSDSESTAKQVAIIPLKPLSPKTTYIVVIDSDLRDSSEVAFNKGAIYAALSQDDRTLKETAFDALEPLRQLTLAQLSALQRFGVSTDEVIASWAFTTQSTSDVLENMLVNVSNQSLLISGTTLDTSTFGGQGLADVYSGTLTVPYYGGRPSVENPTAPLNTIWSGAQDSMLSQFNPTPVQRHAATIPVLMTLPKGDTPASGWPIVIFQHGITQNRSSVLAVADSLAHAGFAAIAIDMPLHGITENSALASLRIAGVSERTFDVDYVTQDAQGTVLIPQSDGVQDSSGRHFINLSHLVVTRDNLRQAVSDLMHLQASLTSSSVANLLDASKVSFVGHSLGAMVGGVFQALSPADSAVFAMPGQQAAYLLAGSASFGPEIVAGLAAQGISADSAEFQQFLLAAQTVVDSADPVNYSSTIQAPSLMFEVVGIDAQSQDQVIPNSVSNAPLAGTEPWIWSQGLSRVSASGALKDGKGVIRFTQGNHASLLSTQSSALVTQTMQEAMVSFIASKGNAILISDESTVQ